MPRARHGTPSGRPPLPPPGHPAAVSSGTVGPARRCAYDGASGASPRYDSADVTQFARAHRVSDGRRAPRVESSYPNVAARPGRDCRRADISLPPMPRSLAKCWVRRRGRRTPVGARPARRDRDAGSPGGGRQPGLPQGRVGRALDRRRRRAGQDGQRLRRRQADELHRHPDRRLVRRRLAAEGRAAPLRHRRVARLDDRLRAARDLRGAARRQRRVQPLPAGAAERTARPVHRHGGARPAAGTRGAARALARRPVQPAALSGHRADAADVAGGARPAGRPVAPARQPGAEGARGARPAADRIRRASRSSTSAACGVSKADGTAAPTRRQVQQRSMPRPVARLNPENPHDQRSIAGRRARGATRRRPPPRYGPIRNGARPGRRRRRDARAGRRRAAPRRAGRRVESGLRTRRRAVRRPALPGRLSCRRPRPDRSPPAIT